MSKSATVVTAPQFGKGINALRAARRERGEAIAKQKEAIDKQEMIRRERSERAKNAQGAIETCLGYGDYNHKTDAREIARNEIRWLLGLVKSEKGQDRDWAAHKALWFTSWQGMSILQEVEEAFGEVFGDNIPDDIAEKLARLITRQAKYIAEKKGIRRPGKTAKDHRNGAHRRHEDNVHQRAASQGAQAHGHMGLQKKEKK